jgi:hypothetical protein
MAAAASQVNKILKGQPCQCSGRTAVTFELVVNLTSAKALGLQMPAALLGQADEGSSDGASSLRTSQGADMTRQVCDWHKADSTRLPSTMSNRQGKADILGRTKVRKRPKRT